MWMELIAIIVTLVLTAFFVEGGLGVGHVLTMLLDAPAIVTILMLSLPVLLWNGMWKDFVRGFRLLKKGYTCSLAEMKRTQDVVELMQKQIICAGIILISFMLIVVLGFLQKPEALGSNVAVILLTAFYVAIFEILLLPVQLEVKRRIIDYMEAE